MLTWRRTTSWSSPRGRSGDAEVAPEVVAVASSDGVEADVEEEKWTRLLPELLEDIVRRVDAGADKWPARRDVVSCACVCRRWRDVAVEVVRPPLECGRITFPSSLKQPGPRDFPMQCFIKRDKKHSTFYLYLSLTHTAFVEKGKFLLAARRFKNGAHTEYIISSSGDDLIQGSNSYVGKLRSDFLGTKFTIFDSQPPFTGAKASRSRSCRRFASKQISPQVSAGNYEVGQICYKFNFLKSRGPRRMHCSIQCPMDQGNSADSLKSKLQDHTPPTVSVLLKNKAPRWHEHLQCWCLNFHGRVTVASVKNCQLVVPAGTGEQWGVEDEETVILQFGKVGDDMFTMDYRHPLSAFQAFTICLTSFGTKLACE